MRAVGLTRACCEACGRARRALRTCLSVCLISVAGVAATGGELSQRPVNENLARFGGPPVVPRA